jgi:hypothetical protein
VDVRWPKKGWWLWRRNAIADEFYFDMQWLLLHGIASGMRTKIAASKLSRLRKMRALFLAFKTSFDMKRNRYDFALIQNLYRQLQHNYLNNYQYSEASSFYIGEQEMRRKAKGPVRSILSVAFLYKIVSYYGERYFRPFWWLMATVFLFPVLLLFDGVNLAPQPGGDAEIINYEWSWSISDLMFDKADFWNCVGANLAVCTFNRSGGTALITSWHQQLVLTLEVVLIITFVTFFILALRRRYKRKSF